MIPIIREVGIHVNMRSQITPLRGSCEVGIVYRGRKRLPLLFDTEIDVHIVVAIPAEAERYLTIF